MKIDPWRGSPQSIAAREDAAEFELETTLNDNDAPEPTFSTLEAAFREGYIRGLMRASVTLRDIADERAEQLAQLPPSAAFAGRLEIANVHRSACTVGGALNQVDELLISDRHASPWPKKAQAEAMRLQSMNWRERAAWEAGQFETREQASRLVAWDNSRGADIASRSVKKG